MFWPEWWINHIIIIIIFRAQVFFVDTAQADGVVPVRGIGSDLSIMDSTFFIAQVLLSVLMGYFVSWTGTVLTYMVGAGLMGGVACVFVLRILPDKRTMLAVYHQQQPAAQPMLSRA